MQTNARTVQGEIERALAEICAEPIRISGAGRTDAGVHAIGQVIDFRTASALDGEAIERGVNALLSKDIAISDVVAVSEEFHSRFSATGRTYEYRIRRSRTRDPLQWRTEYWLPEPLDVEAMHDAGSALVGRHDFAAFAAGVSGERDVRHTRWEEGEDILRFEIEANAFLRGMVRGIVGTLLWVGRGKVTPERFAEILRSKDRTQAGPSAPAQGLCLIRVDYGERSDDENENDE